MFNSDKIPSLLSQFVFAVVDVVVYDGAIVVDDEVVVGGGCGVVFMYLVLFEPFCLLSSQRHLHCPVYLDWLRSLKQLFINVSYTCS